jgi:hypothetical protein
MANKIASSRDTTEVFRINPVLARRCLIAKAGLTSRRPKSAREVVNFGVQNPAFAADNIR